ncbi:MAG: hypothetical protein HZC48_02190 [Nitrospirae bacterium]|nr:hypothetical protein [Nitrospirota bacterium]
MKALAVGSLSILFSFLIIEIGLQLLDKPKQPVSGWNDCRKPKECNSLGFRGKEIDYSDSDYVVILLGDSQVAAWNVPFEQAPESRLQHFLKKYNKNVKVFTIGTHGYGQDQQLLALKEYFKKYRADLVLLFHSTETDILDNIFPVSGRNNTIKPTFWLENGELRGPTEEWLEPVGQRLKLALLWASYFGRPIGESRLEKWKKDILPPPYQPLRYYQEEADYSWQEKWKESPVDAYRGIEYELGMGEGMKFTPRSEMRTYGINLTRRLLSEIEKLSEANNGHFIIFKDEQPWELQNPNMGKVYFLNGKYYKTSMRQYLDNLKDVFDGFEHYRIPLHMDNYTQSPEDQHLNQPAIYKLMEKLSFIISNKEYFKEK